MTTKKQPDRTPWNLLATAMACLILVVGCASPTAEITATNTPTRAAATATPVSATATAAPSTETPTPTKIPITFEIISGYENPAQNTDYQQLLAARLQITETVTFAAYDVGGVTSLVLLAGEPRDKLTGATIQPLTRFLVAGNDLLPLCCPELLALTAASGAKNILLAKVAGKEMAISCLIPYTNGEHYAIIQKDDGSIVLKNYLNKDNPGAPEYLLEEDPDNPERLVTYIDNSPIYIPAAWQEPIALTDASDLFINPFEALKAEYVISDDIELTQLHESIKAPDGYQLFVITNGKLTNRQSMEYFIANSIFAIKNGEAFVFTNSNNLNEVSLENLELDYNTITFKTDENGSLVTNSRDNNSLILTAPFDGGGQALIWNRETRTWEEEIEGYESAYESIMANTREVWNGGANFSLSFNIKEESFEKYKEFTNFTPPDLLALPEGTDPNADREIIENFVINGIEKNDGIILAMNTLTNEIVEVEAVKNGKLVVNIEIISDIGEGIPYYLVGRQA